MYYIVLFVVDEYSFYSVQPSFLKPNTSFKRTRPHKLIWGKEKEHIVFPRKNTNCTLTSFFLCSIFNEWSSVGCHNGKSPHEEYFAQTQLGEKLFKEWSSKSTKEPNLQRGCKQANFGRNAGKWAGRESCSLLHFSQIPFYTFLPNTNTQIQKYKYTSTNIEIQMHKWVGRESFSLLQFS